MKVLGILCSPLEVIALAGLRFKLPDEYTSPIYRYVLSRYGVDMCPAKNRIQPDK